VELANRESLLIGHSMKRFLVAQLSVKTTMLLRCVQHATVNSGEPKTNALPLRQDSLMTSVEFDIYIIWHQKTLGWANSYEQDLSRSHNHTDNRWCSEKDGTLNTSDKYRCK
jgi:hypothetical protein